MSTTGSPHASVSSSPRNRSPRHSNTNSRSSSVSSSIHRPNSNAITLGAIAQTIHRASSSKKLDLRALRMSLIKSQQEEEFGVNMYDTLTLEDIEKIEIAIRTQGSEYDDIALAIFESKGFVSKKTLPILQVVCY